MTRQVTGAIIALTVAVWLAWETVVVGGPKGDTFSEVIRDWAHQWPALAYAAGVLIGHWFVPWRHGRTGARYWLAFAGAWAPVVVVQVVHLRPSLAVVVGGLLGATLWTLNPKVKP